MIFRRCLESRGSAKDLRAGAGARLDVPEKPVCEFDHVCGHTVAGYDQDRVRGRVVAVVEVCGIFDRCVLEMGEVPVAVVGVRVAVEGETGQRNPRKPAIGSVEDVYLDLLLDDRDLVAKVLIREGESAHPFGFQPQHEFEPAGRKRLIVRGEVGEGVPVDHPARALDQLHVLGLADVGRPLEHQVFKKMGESGPPLGLGAETHVVDDRDRDKRAGVVGGDEHTKTVTEGGALEVGEGRPRSHGLATRSVSSPKADVL